MATVGGTPVKAAVLGADRRRSAILDRCAAYHDPQDVQAMGLYLYFRTLESAQDPIVMMDGRPVLMLGSNNYLGLTNHPKVKESAIEALRKYGTGCAGSRFLNGTLDIHVRLEEELADFCRREAAVTFSTGFQVNLGVISSLVGKNDTVHMDKMDHASIIDGCRLSFGTVKKFRHGHLEDLAKQLREGGEGGRLVVVDGVFSMEGDIVDLPGLVRVAKPAGAAIMVDDAHSLGVLGENGRGTAEHFGLENDIDIVMGTFSKSLASIGGFVAAKASVINYVKHRARPLIFSASLPPASVGAARAALAILRSEPERRAQLWANTRRMKLGLIGLGFDTGNSETPIVPIIVGHDLDAFRMARLLQEEGVFVNPVVSPGTPPGRALIRTSYMSTHTAEQLDRGLEAFAKVGKAMGLI